MEPSEPLIQRPVRRNGTSRWSAIPNPASFPRPATWYSGGGMEGNFVALNAQTGELLWHVNLGGPNASGPVSFAVNGKQYIVGTGEGALYVFGLPD